HGALGLPGALAGGLFGGTLGYCAGRLPYIILRARVLCGLAHESTPRLRERLASQYYISHLILAELIRRGEDIRTDLPILLGMLRSEFWDERRFGFRSLQIAFPDLAA